MFCELFGYSKQAYYKAQIQHDSVIEQERHTKDLVLGLRRQMPRLGTRKLYHVLKSELDIGSDKLFDLLRSEGC